MKKEHWEDYLTPKMSIKRKQLIEDFNNGKIPSILIDYQLLNALYNNDPFDGFFNNKYPVQNRNPNPSIPIGTLPNRNSNK